jgi:hypothetical protein
VAPPASRSFAGSASYVKQERAGRREGVWELAGDGVRSIMCSDGAFIGQEVGGEGGQKVAGAGALATCDGQHRARRPCARAGGVLSWRRGTVGRRWRDYAGRQLAERKRERRGGPGGVLLFLPCLTARVGAGEAGLDRGSAHGMATGLG